MSRLKRATRRDWATALEIEFGAIYCEFKTDCLVDKEETAYSAMGSKIRPRGKAPTIITGRYVKANSRTSNR